MRPDGDANTLLSTAWVVPQDDPSTDGDRVRIDTNRPIPIIRHTI